MYLMKQQRNPKASQRKTSFFGLAGRRQSLLLYDASKHTPREMLIKRKVSRTPSNAQSIASVEGVGLRIIYCLNRFGTNEGSPRGLVDSMVNCGPSPTGRRFESASCRSTLTFLSLVHFWLIKGLGMSSRVCVTG